ELDLHVRASRRSMDDTIFETGYPSHGQRSVAPVQFIFPGFPIHRCNPRNLWMSILPLLCALGVLVVFALTTSLEHRLRMRFNPRSSACIRGCLLRGATA